MESLVADLEKQLGRKNTFESAAAALASLFRDRYADASPSEKKSMYAAACRAGALLQSRYTGKGFWTAGLKLFEEAGDTVVDPTEQQNMRNWTFKAREFVGEDDNPQERSTRPGPSAPFLFEGQLTVGSEPPPPRWLVAQNRLRALAMAEQQETNPDRTLLESIQGALATLANLQSNLVEDTPGLEEAIEATLQEFAHKKTPPASKEEVAKLPVVDVTEEVLEELGSDTECAVCREVLILNDKMQEMPCKHYFHPPCLQPWLEENNSCPICRYEMKTDDHEYESWKEREREAEADRKGAANAVRGGEYMYI